MVPAAVPALSPHRSPKPIANAASAAQALQSGADTPGTSGCPASPRAGWAEAAEAAPAEGLMDGHSNSRFDYEEWQW